MAVEELEDSISSWAEAYCETEEDRLGDLLHEEKPTAGDDMGGRKDTTPYRALPVYVCDGSVPGR